MFEHNYNQVSREVMYNWLNKHLELKLPSPIEEKPFKPVPPTELSVYDDTASPSRRQRRCRQALPAI